MKEKLLLRITVLILCVCCASLALILTTTCSPLYATSFWTDTNIYFTMGRGILHGLFPYRDLYDHKGPLLYYLYSIGAWISEHSFAGVFLLEIVSLGAACYLAYKICKLYVKNKSAALAVPIMAMISVSCTAFNQGGSAEEFCLPALITAIYVFLRLTENESSPKDAILFGASAGYLFLIKYTVCGLHLGLGLTTIVFLIWKENIQTAFKCILKWFAGFLIVLIPVMGVLAVTGTFSACIQAYFIDNLTVYEGTPLSFTGHIYNALAYLRTQSVINPMVCVFAVTGFIYLIWRLARFHDVHRICQAFGYPVSAGLFLLFVYWGEMAHPYYALVFASLVCVGLVPVIQLVGKGSLKMPMKICLAAAVLAVLPVSSFFSQAKPLLNVKQPEMPQYIFAEKVNAEEHATLLDITSLDQGFYFASGVLPAFRYFADNNLPSKEKESEIRRYLEEGLPDYVVTVYRDPGNQYELITEADGFFDLASLRRYKLYGRRKR